MTDISLCTNISCPQRQHCLRGQDSTSTHQTYTWFEYQHAIGGVRCDGYLPKHQTPIYYPLENAETLP